MPRPTDAPERLLRASAALFGQRGYDGVGLNEILAGAKSPKGSFYHHFPQGKEQLGVAVIHFGGRKISRQIDDAFGEAENLPAGLRRLIAAWGDSFEASGFNDCCPVASVALDTVPRLAAHTAAVREVFAGWEARFIFHARRLGETSFSASDAEHLLMLLEGAWILARVQQSKEPLHRAIEAFLAGWQG